MRDKTRIAKPTNKVTAIALTVALAIGFLFPARAYPAGAFFLVDIAKRANSANLPQCASQPVVASNLRAPVKLIFTQHGNLLVAEMGFGPNSGRISIVDPATGQQRTLLDGLPSGFILPSNITSGPSGLAMRGRTPYLTIGWLGTDNTEELLKGRAMNALYITIGGGDSTLPGAALNTRVPNPNPSSPLFSSVLAVDFTPHVERNTAGFALTYADHLALQNGSEVNLDNGGGDKIKVRLVADFPDYVAEPRADEQHNVRPAEPFGLVSAANHLYVVDSASNTLSAVDMRTNEVTTLTTFAPLLSKYAFEFGSNYTSAYTTGKYAFEFGPNIRFFGSQLLVTSMPTCEECQSIPSGISQVRIVDPATGSDEPFITGLSAAIDVLPIMGRGRTSEFLTLELSANVQTGLPGRLRRYASPDAAPFVIADCLNAPTSMARYERTGELFITEIFTGRIVKVAAP